MRKLTLLMFSLFLAAILPASPVRAQGPDLGDFMYQLLGGSASKGLFNETERQVLRAYLHSIGYGRDDGRHDEDDYEHDHWKHKGRKRHLPPGLRMKLARGGELPPGWQRKVARGEVLEEDLYRSSYDLPPEWRRKLPPGPPGTSIRRIDDRVVRIIDATREILDVLQAR